MFCLVFACLLVVLAKLYSCISHRFASGGKYVISLMVHGTTCHCMFWPLLMTQAASRDGCDNDDEDVGALCCHKRTTTICGQCNERYCAECIDLHTCGDEVGSPSHVTIHPVLFPWNTFLGRGFGCQLTIH